MKKRLNRQNLIDPDCRPCCEAAPQAREQCCRTLSQVDKKSRCRIRRHRSRGTIRRRLLDLGFIPDAEVEMIRRATLGDPLELRLGDCYVTLRKREADLIDVWENQE